MLPILFETKNHTEKFTTGDAIQGLSRRQGYYYYYYYKRQI